MNLCIDDVGQSGWGGEDVVDSPADVSFACTRAIGPPGVAFAFGVKLAKGVRPTVVDPLVECEAFFGEEAAGFLVLFGAGEVDLFMCGVEVAHNEDFLTFLGPSGELLSKMLVEFEFEGHAAIVAVLSVSVGEIAIDDQEFSEAGHLDSAFAVLFFESDAGGDFIEGAAAVESHSAVAKAFCRVKVHVPPFGVANIRRDLVFQCAGFLEADDVCGRVGQPFVEAFACGCANAIHVPRDNFAGHGLLRESFDVRGHYSSGDGNRSWTKIAGGALVAPRRWWF